MQYTSTYQAPMGEILLACDEAGLTGYAGGLQRKIGPLTQEGVDMSRLFVPKRETAL